MMTPLGTGPLAVSPLAAAIAGDAVFAAETIIYLDANESVLWAPGQARSPGEHNTAKDRSIPISYVCTSSGTTGIDSPITAPLNPWTDATAYGLGDYITAVLDDQPVIFEVTTAGTSDATEPTWDPVLGNTTADNTVVYTAVSWWRLNPGDQVTDGTVTWQAATPDSWSSALGTLESAFYAWQPGSVIYMDRNHREEIIAAEVSNYIINGPVLHDQIPSVYRVDKATNTYSPHMTDGFTWVNVGFGYTDVTIRASAHWYGIYFEPNDDLLIENCDFYSEDCGIHYGATLAARLTVKYSVFEAQNCFVKGFAAGELYVYKESDVTFRACEFFVTCPVTGYIQGLGTLDYNNIKFIDCDLSKIDGYGIDPTIMVDTSDFAISDDRYSPDHRQRINFVNCKMPPDYQLWDGDFYASLATIITAENCSIGSGTHGQESRVLAGYVGYDESVYLNDGYVHRDGNIPLSQILQANDVVNPALNLEAFAITTFLNSSGSKVITVGILEDFTDPLTTFDLCMDVFYFSAETNTFHSISRTSKAYLPTDAVELSDHANTEWNNPPAGSRVKRISAVVSAARIGTVYAIVQLNKYESGKTVRINPKLEVN